MIDVPEKVTSGELLVITSVSGGKDSTAMMLALREAGVEFRAVFADTGWEAPETYTYLDLLREKLGPIDVVGAEGGMVAKIRSRAGFPARMQRWCTRELKIDPLRAYHDTVDGETVSTVGVRASESVYRSRLRAFEDCDTWGGFVWRPLLAWSVEDVLAIHHRHGVPVNPLYQRGHDRVGCYPCVYANKGDIRLVADYAPDRIATIRELEAEVVEIRDERNESSPGRYEPMMGTFFQGRDARSGFVPIDRVVAWSRTSRGGKQLPLLDNEPDGGCFRWGMCEPPSSDGKNGDQ